tara:strand:+ start:542 stop:982 length:441 start_codon:yes stop_codon:yes gene_type:complete
MKLLKDNESQNETTTTVEFLVPFTKSIVDLLSDAEIKEWVLTKELKNLHLNDAIYSGGIINTTSIIKDFSVSILYVGIRNFILTIKGIEKYEGFCIIITNKGMVVNDNSSEEPTNESKILKNEFLNNYKSPYLITETFLKFRKQGS